MKTNMPTGGDTGPVHQRYEICTRLGIPFAMVDVEDCHTREDAILWIVANQLGRRNLTPSQKAALALELEKQLASEAKKRRAATLKQNQVSVPEIFPEREQGEAREKAAKMVGANPHYVTDAKKIEQDAPEILEQVKQGKLSIPQAKRVAALPGEERPAAFPRSEKGGLLAPGRQCPRPYEVAPVPPSLRPCREPDCKLLLLGPCGRIPQHGKRGQRETGGDQIIRWRCRCHEPA